MPIKINGATSGSTTITAPATGSDETIELSTALAAKLPIAGGKILQIVRATDSTLRSTTSATPVDVTGMSVTITPQKSDSAIIIIATFFNDTSGSGSDNRGAFQITDSSNNVILGTPTLGDYSTDAFVQNVATMIGYATPATTSAVTYKLRFYQVSTTSVRVLNADMTGQMYAIEVSA
jgi:hypothetical protein